MSDKVAKTAKRHPRPFPWRCSTCGKEEVRPATIAHTATVKHHGRQHKVEVPDLPVLRCGSCSAILFENDSHERILRALRTQLNLLQPEEIRKERKERGLKQKELAQAVHAALATVCRWETGTIIQSRRTDRALREFFARTPVRSTQLATSAAGSDLGLSPEVAAKFRQLIESCVADTLQNMPPESRDSFVDDLCQKREVLGQLFTIVAGVRVTASESTPDSAVSHLIPSRGAGENRWIRFISRTADRAVFSPKRGTELHYRNVKLFVVGRTPSGLGDVIRQAYFAEAGGIPDETRVQTEKEVRAGDIRPPQERDKSWEHIVANAHLRKSLVSKVRSRRSGIDPVQTHRCLQEASEYA